MSEYVSAMEQKKSFKVRKGLGQKKIDGLLSVIWSKLHAKCGKSFLFIISTYLKIQMRDP